MQYILFQEILCAMLCETFGGISKRNTTGLCAHFNYLYGKNLISVQANQKIVTYMAQNHDARLTSANIFIQLTCGLNQLGLIESSNSES